MTANPPLNNLLNDPLTFIEKRLYAALAPSSLTVKDDSAEHMGHAGAAGGGHFSVHIVSSAFVDKTRPVRHRLVYAALADVMQDGIHALAIAAYTPEEMRLNNNIDNY